MKTVLTTLNAKYIHPSVGLRMLYVATKNVEIIEYTIKEDINKIVSELVTFDIVGIGVYIWNVNYLKEITDKLKAINPEIIIILGGPEVSYEPNHFLNNYLIDYVISGEASSAFNLLITSLKDKETNINIDGVYYKDKKINQFKILVEDLEEVEKRGIPYDIKLDVNKIFYIETSRGCPYNCSYCLSSRETNLRFYSFDYICKCLDIAFKNNVKVIKFLDRSFNVNYKLAIKIIDYIIKNHKPNQVFQFEINADIINEKLVDYLIKNVYKGLIRFEIGIQSVYDKTNLAVDRIQDFDKLKNNILKLQANDLIDLHVDLIAGLPYEDYNQFINSFNQVFDLKSKELQLGFLKMLRGTKLRSEANKYGYCYQEKAPYEIKYNDFITNEELNKIHIVEEALEKLWNSKRFKLSMNYLLNDINYFEFFYDIGLRIIKNSRCSLDELFLLVYDYLNEMNLLNKNLLILLIKDYYYNFKTKPKLLFKDKKDKLIKRKEIIKKIIESGNEIDRQLLYKYSIIETIEDVVLIIIYQDFSCVIKEVILEKE